MTSAMTRARPDEVLRAAALLGATADELGTAISACRRAAAVPWVGRAQERYQQRLGRLAHDLVGLRSAFDTACDALLSYGQALSGLQPLAEEADRLTAVGDETLLSRVDGLRWEATQGELNAAAQLVFVLDQLTARAPASGAGATARHDASNFALGMQDWFTSWGSMASALAGSLPGVGSAHDRAKAREELGDAAAEMAQPWKQVQDLVDAIRNGMGFRALGGISAAAVFRVPGRKDSWAVRMFGTHDEMTDAMLTVMRRGAAAGDDVLESWAAQRVQAELVAELKRLDRVRLPSLATLLADGVNLVHHEAKDGHTMIRHIGRDIDFLRERQREDVRMAGVIKRVGSFDTLDQAEALVDDVLRANAQVVKDYLADKHDLEPLELNGHAAGSSGAAPGQARQPGSGERDPRGPRKSRWHRARQHGVLDVMNDDNPLGLRFLERWSRLARLLGHWHQDIQLEYVDMYEVVEDMLPHDPGALRSLLSELDDFVASTTTEERFAELERLNDDPPFLLEHVDAFLTALRQRLVDGMAGEAAPLRSPPEMLWPRDIPEGPFPELLRLARYMEEHVSGERTNPFLSTERNADAAAVTASRLEDLSQLYSERLVAEIVRLRDGEVPDWFPAVGGPEIWETQEDADNWIDFVEFLARWATQREGWPDEYAPEMLAELRAEAAG